MQNSKKDAAESTASGDAVLTTQGSMGAAHTSMGLDHPSNEVDNSEAKPESAPGKSPLFILLIMVGMVTAGSLCTIVGKIMD